jgi:uncharacterized membrane protein YsdA (DUF1294 family)
MSQKKRRANKGTWAGWLYAIVLVAIVAVAFALIFTGTEWPGYIVWLISWSIATFVIYGLDKGMSKTAFLRAPEVLLNGAALMGGFAGGWLGMLVWHHKIRKQTFYLVLLLSTLLHGGIIYYLFFFQKS